LPGGYEPEGRLLTTHLQLRGIRRLMEQHRESSSRRVMVGPAQASSFLARNLRRRVVRSHSQTTSSTMGRASKVMTSAS